MSDASRQRPRRRADHNTAANTWQRWIPEPIRPPQTEPASADIPRATAADLERAARQRRAALEQAREAAIQTGHDEGYEAGHAKGHKIGHAAGQQQGYKEGFDQGQREGRDQGMEQIRQAQQTLDDLITSCAASLTTIEEDMGQAMIRLAVHIAQQVVHSTVQTQPEKLLDLIRDVVTLEAEPDTPIQLSVHPDDLPLVQDSIDSNPERSAWRAVADDGITQGGCHISTPLGDIDATLETRWQRVIATLGER